MVLTGYKYNGIAIRAPGGGLAGDTFCCCDVTPPADNTCCCPDDELPADLLVTISAKTGDCDCLPDTMTLSRIEPVEPPVNAEWQGQFDACETTNNFTLRCMEPDEDHETCWWTFENASFAVTSEIVSSSCNPFELVFDVDNSVGATNCTGTFRVTITIP